MKLKKHIAAILTLLALLSLASCTNTPPATGSTSSDASTSDASSAVSSSPEPTYVPGDPTTAPLVLTEIPETWVFTETEDTVLGLLDCYTETVTYDDGTVETEYKVFQEGNRLYSFWWENEQESYKADQTVRTEEEKRKIADEYLSRLGLLTYLPECETEDSRYMYQCAEERNGWIIPDLLSDLSETWVRVDEKGKIYSFEGGMPEMFSDLDFKGVTVDEIKARAESEEAFPGDKYSDTEKYTCGFEEDYHNICIYEEDGLYQLWVAVRWQAIENNEEEDVAEVKRFCYPIAECGCQYDMEAFDTFYCHYLKWNEEHPKVIV